MRSPMLPAALRRALLIAAACLPVIACRGSSPPASSNGSTIIADELGVQASALTVLPRTGWTARASDTASGSPAANGIDASTTTRWQSGRNQVAGIFFQVDMLAPQSFVQVRLDAGTSTNDFPRSFQVNVSSDASTMPTNWTTVATATGTSQLVVVSFAPQTARHIQVKLVAVTPAPTNWWTIADLNVVGTMLSRTGWTATASSTNGSNMAANALDGSATTRWTSASAQTNQTFKVDMRSAQTFNQLFLDAGTSTNNFPRAFKVEISSDDAAWTQVTTGTGTTAFINITFPFQNARFIKITQTMTNATPWSIQELNVFGQPVAATTHPRGGWVATASATGTGSAAASALDGNSGTRWTSGAAQANGQTFRVDMQVLRAFNQITLDAGSTSGAFPHGYQVHVSRDGTTWGDPIATGSPTTQVVTISFPQVTARHIRITQTAAFATAWAIQELNVAGLALSRTSWVATASATGGTDVAANALDGTAASRWNTGAAQTSGQSFRVDQGTAQIFNQLVLDAGTSINNFPRAFEVAVSSDGVNWGSVVSGTGATPVVTVNFPTQTARFFRISLTGGNSNPWSIHELNVFRAVQPCDTACTPLEPQCHVAGVCDPGQGTCTNPIKPNGTICDDANACTTGELCQAGACGGGTVVTCAANQCQTVGACVPLTGCPTPQNKVNGTACNDSDACTTGDSCQSGTCAHSGTVTCTTDQCHTVGSCAPLTGCPAPQPKPEGSACNNGNLCITGQSCQAGVCGGGTAVTCVANNQCQTVGSCVPSSGCPTPVPKPNGSACSDENACTQSDVCMGGQCLVGALKTCPLADQCHQAGACNPMTGQCSNPPKADGTPCSDGQACTQNDVCQIGICQAGAPLVCMAQDSCHVAGVCVPSTGLCTNPPLNGGTCASGGFVYDGAGRLVQDGDLTLVYDAFDQLLQVNPTATGPVYAAVEDMGATLGFSRSKAINNLGVAVGWDIGDSSPYEGEVPVIAFQYSGGVRTPLPGVPSRFFPKGINDAGVIVGTGGPGPFSSWFNPIRRLPDGTIQFLLGSGLSGGIANAINASGQMAGYGYVVGYPTGLQIFRAQPDGTVQILGSLTGPNYHGGARAFGIAESGAVVGDGERANGDPVAVIYRDGLGLQDMNLLSPASAGWDLQSATAIKGDLVVGRARQGASNRAFRLNLATGEFGELGLLPETDEVNETTVPFSVNASGHVVGAKMDGIVFTVRRAFFYSEQSGIVDLNTLIDPASGWTLLGAFALNDFDEVVGVALSATGETRGFKLKVPFAHLSTGRSVVAQTHTYGYDGLRTSTTTGAGTPTAKTQYWFTQDHTEHDGKREHYVRVGGRIVARVGFGPAAGATAGAATTRQQERASTTQGPGFGNHWLGLLLLLGAAGGLAGSWRWGWRGRRWAPAVASILVASLVASSCGVLGLGNDVARAVAWTLLPSETLSFHQGLAAGPAIITAADATIHEERRYEPFGQPIDSYRDGVGVGAVNFVRDPQNSLGKMTDPSTGWSYHGARWMAPQTGRWLSPDPAVKGPDGKFMVAPWQLNPYGYVSGNPTTKWDSTGQFEEPVHGALTYHLAIYAGYSERDAAEIALACAGVDHNPMTVPVDARNIVEGRTVYYHFRSPLYALDTLRASNTNNQAFGTALHTLEDVGFPDALGPHMRGRESPWMGVIGHPLRITEKGNLSHMFSHVADQAHQDPLQNKRELQRVYSVLVESMRPHQFANFPDPEAAAKAIDAVIGADSKKRVDEFIRSKPMGASQSYFDIVNDNHESHGKLAGGVDWGSDQIDSTIE